tara:strand:- start:456 stop:644 length:189 start_codon:yes stop_codon:yes gene_type:complete
MNQSKMDKKLYRHPKAGYLGGVCHGVGEWSSLPPILWRLIFLFILPYAFWVYILLWIFLPKK